MGLCPKAAALLLLLVCLLCPQLARCLALPRNVVENTALESKVSRREPDNLPNDRVPKVVDYNLADNVLKLQLTCRDCPDKEKQRLANEIISIAIPSNAGSCNPKEPAGLTVNGQHLEPSKSLELYPASEGSLSSPDDESSILKHVRWYSFCACRSARTEDECMDRIESIFVLEILDLQGFPAGFTLSYGRSGRAGSVRISDFPESPMEFFVGSSSHWRTPLLDLQRGAVPTSTLISSFSSVSPSLTTSASTPESTPEYTWATSPVVHVTRLPSPPAAVHVTSTPSVPQQSGPTARPAPFVPLIETQAQQSWQHPLTASDTISALQHTLSSLGSKAQGAAQLLAASLHSLRHCYEDEAPQSIKEQDSPKILSSTPSNTARATIPTASLGPELPDLAVSASTSDFRHVTTQQAVKAFQITALIIILATLICAMFVIVRRNPRLRAELAAQCEERRNKRLFRRAACRYRWESMWNRVRGFTTFRVKEEQEKLTSAEAVPSPNHRNGIDWAVWHEKQVSTESGTILTHTSGLWEGISELRQAHRLVDGMVRAEEGRYGRNERTSRHQRRWSGSASSNKTPPPPYEEEEEEVFVTDGVRYVRRVTDSTPSSVIDTSPRPSEADSDSESEKE